MSWDRRRSWCYDLRRIRHETYEGTRHSGGVAVCSLAFPLHEIPGCYAIVTVVMGGRLRCAVIYIPQSNVEYHRRWRRGDVATHAGICAGLWDGSHVRRGIYWYNYLGSPPSSLKPLSEYPLSVTVAEGNR